MKNTQVIQLMSIVRLSIFMLGDSIYIILIRKKSNHIFMILMMTLL